MEKSLTTNLDKNLPSAAGRIASMPKVTPEVMMIVYLDEIAGRLAELQDALTEVTAEGFLSGKSISVTDNPVRIPIVARHLSLYNDGADSIYILQLKGKPLAGDAEIKKNGQFSLDFQTRKARNFYLVCASGETATVRVFTW